MNWGYCLWLYLVRGTNGIENNGIMRDYDVIRCESDCAISQNWVFTSNFGALYLNMVHTTKRWYKILKFPKCRLNWGINTLLKYKFAFKIDFIRVWPWKIDEFWGTCSVGQSWFSSDVACANDCAISH